MKPRWRHLGFIIRCVGILAVEPMSHEIGCRSEVLKYLDARAPCCPPGDILLIDLIRILRHIVSSLRRVYYGCIERSTLTVCLVSRNGW
ncbi:uncharacterized protein EI90DRAFT_3039408 [Cantharellus anzutake]|uniref:uncharacterized protein n=1 Tax=Cantharellus anzutake TaxID=1750568 RepID=UPI0019080BBD|nr:uncharacterized protein EI90DRAFT_3039408 [Cantharellus anzutake]KAF8338849.1 hypothetical protein EI90DRAFT_3039408 [Cantharellus anzutake]